MTQQNEKTTASPSQDFGDAAPKTNGNADAEKQAEWESRLAYRRRHLLDNIPGYKQYNGPP